MVCSLALDYLSARLLIMTASFAPLCSALSCEQFRVSHGRHRGLGNLSTICSLYNSSRRLATTGFKGKDGFMAGDGVWVKSPRDVSPYSPVVLRISYTRALNVAANHGFDSVSM
jgi:hypothetical protein